MMRKFHLGAFSGAKDHYHDNEIGICAMAGTALVNASLVHLCFLCHLICQENQKLKYYIIRSKYLLL